MELSCADFDGNIFHVTNGGGSGAKNTGVITISLTTKCGAHLNKYGAQEKLKAVYGKYLVDPEAGTDATLSVDLSQLPDNTGL